MTKKWHNRIMCACGLLLALLAGCEEPYQPPVLEAPNNFLVVNGFLNAGNGPTTISLLRSQNLQEETLPPPVSGAAVFVEDEQGARYQLQENRPGSYSIGRIDYNLAARYRVVIKVAGKDYASEFVEIKKTPPIDKVSWRAEGDGMQIYVTTHDPASNTRYYRWDYEDTWEITAAFFAALEYKNGEVVHRDYYSENIYKCWKSGSSTDLKLGSSVKLSSDVISDFPVLRIPGNSEKIRLKYSILVKQYALTKEAFEYLEILKRNTENIGTLFDPLPTQLRGNIQCLTDPSEIVIGHIGGYSVEEKRIFISREELPQEWRPPFPTCTGDTISVFETDAWLSSGDNLPVSEIYSIAGPLLGYLVAPVRCVDCRVSGTNERPAYWE